MTETQKTPAQKRALYTDLAAKWDQKAKEAEKAGQVKLAHAASVSAAAFRELVEEYAD